MPSLPTAPPPQCEKTNRLAYDKRIVFPCARSGISLLPFLHSCVCILAEEGPERVCVNTSAQLPVHVHACLCSNTAHRSHVHVRLGAGEHGDCCRRWTAGGGWLQPFSFIRGVGVRRPCEGGRGSSTSSSRWRHDAADAADAAATAAAQRAGSGAAGRGGAAAASSASRSKGGDQPRFVHTQSHPSLISLDSTAHCMRLLFRHAS